MRSTWTHVQIIIPEPPVPWKALPLFLCNRFGNWDLTQHAAVSLVLKEGFARAFRHGCEHTETGLYD